MSFLNEGCLSFADEAHIEQETPEKLKTKC